MVDSSEEQSLRPITILHVIGQMNRAGAETLVMNLMRQMDPQRVRFDFAVHTAQPGDYDEEIYRLGGRIFVAPRFTVLNQRTYRLWWDRFFQEHPEIDIVHGHIASSARVYLASAQVAGIPTIAHSHSTDGKTRRLDLEYYAFRTLTRGTVDVADQLIGCSQEAITARYGSGPRTADALVINNGVDTRVFRRDDDAGRAVRRELSIPEDALVFGTVGRLTEVKNPHFTINVASEVLSRSPRAHFLWAGRGPLENHIREIIHSRGIEGNVHLLGIRGDIERILNAMDVFILPSHYEGLGLSLIEAQSTGVPVIASDGVPPVALVASRSHQHSTTPPDVTRWADIVLEEKRAGRFDGVPEVRAAGFDIKDASTTLERLYTLYAAKRTER